MANAQLFTQCIIKIDGAPMSDDFMFALEEVVVDASLYLPDMFTIEVRDPDLEWANSPLLDVGKVVEITIETGEQQGSLKGLLIKGEITALEPTFSAGGDSTMLIRGYDRSHRLHRGKKTRTFLKQTDSDVVNKIAGEVGLSSEIDATNIRYDYIMQQNQTNMEFLLARAQRIGYQVYAAEGKLFFKKGEATLGDGPELKLGETLDTFRPRMVTAHQADKMIVRGWNAKEKKVVTGNAAPNGTLNQGGMTKTGGATASGAFGSSDAVVVNEPVFSVDEADALVTGLSNDISRDFMQAEGHCIPGDPRIKAGWTITVANVGPRFNGKYFVTEVTHVYNAGGYETSFSISGRQPNTLSHLLDSGKGHDEGRGLVQGVATALVTNLNDPDNLGRVKIQYPWLGDNIESDWVRISAPMGGSGRGFLYLPEVNDEVLVAFEHGSVHHPYLLGTLWNTRDKPPLPNSEAVGGGKVNQRMIKSRSGHVIILDDTDGSEQIIIRDKTGNNEMVIDSTKNNMAIKVDGDFSVEAKGKVILKSMQDMIMESKANGQVKTAGNLNVQANANATIKGLQLTLEGTAMSTLKAPTVSVQGSALTEIKGALVKIN